MFCGFGRVFFFDGEEGGDGFCVLFFFFVIGQGSCSGQETDTHASTVGLDAGKLDKADFSGLVYVGGAAGADVDAWDGDDAYLAFYCDFTAVFELCERFLEG